MWPAEIADRKKLSWYELSGLPDLAPLGPAYEFSAYRLMNTNTIKGIGPLGLRYCGDIWLCELCGSARDFSIRALPGVDRLRVLPDLVPLVPA